MKKAIRTLLMAAAIATLAAMPAWADTITSITIKAGIPSDEEEMDEGSPVSPSFTIEGGNCYIGDATEYSNSTSGKTAHSYTIEVYANGGSYFPSSSSALTVNTVGCTGVSKVSIDGSNHATIRVTAYPYYKWEEPDVEENDSGKSLKISKHGAPTADYIIEYVNQSGEARSVSGSTTSGTLSISAYKKEYTGNSSYKDDAYITGIAVRVRGAAGENTNTAPSDWVMYEGDVNPEDYNFVEYDSWSDIGSPTSYNTSSGTGVTEGRWEGSGTTWRYIINGAYVYSRWVQDNGYWYYIGGDGLMQVGLINLNNQIFYLNPNYDSTYGRMLTGWQTVNGASHYFQETYNSNYGMMLQ
jgi:glucan-binding YG repeat protein